MKLQKGYKLIWGERSSGRGCGGKDVVVDNWGYHDTAPEIEAVRLD